MNQNRRWVFGIIILVYLCSIGAIFGFLSVLNSGKSKINIPDQSLDFKMTINVLITRTFEATIRRSITPSSTFEKIEATPEPAMFTPTSIPTFWPTHTATDIPTFTSTPTFEIVSLVPVFCTCKISQKLYCGSFKNQAEAQSCYVHCGGVKNDIYQLDKNQNGIACGQWKYSEP